jgi:hypothetical protein
MQIKDFLKDLLKIGLTAILRLSIAFGVGTAGTAVVCLYYNVPIAVSLLGGIVVLGIALALMSHSPFDID